MDVATTDPQKLYRRLAFIIRPDLVENHEDALKLNEAYEKAKKGRKEKLMEMYEKKFPDGIITPELTEFEKELMKRKEIFEVIRLEIEELRKIAKKKRTPNILRNNQLRQRYRTLCEENNIKYTSDFIMDYDSDFINKYLYSRGL